MNDLSTKVLDVPGASTANGTLLQQWSPNGNRQQQWQLLPVAGGYYQMKNLNSGKVLDMTDASVYAGWLLQQWDYFGTANQQWQLVPAN